MSYKILEDLSEYFNEKEITKIYSTIVENRKSNEFLVGEELAIDNKKDSGFNKLWIISFYKEKEDNIYVKIINAIVYDQIPDIVLDQYNEIKKMKLETKEIK